MAYIKGSDMPTALQETPAIPVTLFPPRKSWTRDECVALEVSGLLDQHKYELVLGELVNKMGKRRPHVITMALVKYWLEDTFGREFVNGEAPIDVAAGENATNEPEPDIIVLGRALTLFAANPQPSEIRLVVEISDSTLHYDLNVKGPLYARAGIVEFWVVDIQGKRVIVHREPVDGNYSSVVAYACGESINLLAAPQAAFPVTSAFPSTQIS